MADLQKNVVIKNRKAKFEYEFLDTYVAGIVLAGTEIKAIREGKASIAEGFCEFQNSELFNILACQNPKAILRSCFLTNFRSKLFSLIIYLLLFGI